MPSSIGIPPFRWRHSSRSPPSRKRELSSADRRVPQRHNTAFEGLRALELQPHLLLGLSEDRHAFADRRWVDKEVVLVDEIVANELGDKGAAAVGDDIAAGRLLEATDLLRQGTFGQRRVLPRRI
jgi:hypothetical protein